MPDENCPICSAGRAPAINQMASEGMGYRKIVEATEFGERQVRRHLKECDQLRPEGVSESSEIAIEDIERPLQTDEEILAVLGMSSDVYQIVGGVNVSARTLASGSMLYSYRAKTQKIKEAPLHEWSTWREVLLFNPPRIVLASSGSTYAITIADPQIGKKGTQEAIGNWQSGVISHVARIKRMIVSGVAISEILIAFMGDEHEGVANNYANQPHTVEMNFSSQLEADFDLRMWTIKYVCDEIADVNIKVSSVISNHGEFTRNGSKEPVTTKGDNSSTMIARLCQRAFNDSPGYKEIEWLIAGGEPAVITELSGVKVYLSHGYIEKGRGTGPEARQVAAMNNQILGNPLEFGDIKCYLLAHYHHAWYRQDRNFTVFGAPALEARRSSEWMLEQYGVWSEPGMAGMLIGKDMGPTGWGEYTVL